MGWVGRGVGGVWMCGRPDNCENCSRANAFTSRFSLSEWAGHGQGGSRKGATFEKYVGGAFSCHQLSAPIHPITQTYFTFTCQHWLGVLHMLHTGETPGGDAAVILLIRQAQSVFVSACDGTRMRTTPTHAFEKCAHSLDNGVHSLPMSSDRRW